MPKQGFKHSAASKAKMSASHIGLKTNAQTHGLRYHPLYTCWKTMKQRCINTNRKDYHLYGGRGIAVCDRWFSSFENFLEDIGERPEGRSLDRIDNDGNYEPANCRWATAKEQRANQKRGLAP